MNKTESAIKLICEKYSLDSQNVQKWCFENDIDITYKYVYAVGCNETIVHVPINTVSVCKRCNNYVTSYGYEQDGEEDSEMDENDECVIPSVCSICAYNGYNNMYKKIKK